MRRGARVARELRAAHDPADEQCLLHSSEPAKRAFGAARETVEQVVEGADRAAQQRRTPRQELALDPVDVRPVRHDEDRLEPVPGLEHVDVTAEQELDLARVGRARDEAERHPPTLALQSAREAHRFASRGQGNCADQRRGLPSAPWRGRPGFAGAQTPVPSPQRFVTLQPALRKRPEAKTAAKRRLSRRPDARSRRPPPRASAQHKPPTPHSLQDKTARSGPETALSGPRSSVSPSEETRSVSELQRLWLAPATRGGASWHPAGAVVAEVCLLRPAPRVRVRHPHHGTLPLVDLVPTAVAHEHRFPSHPCPPLHGRFPLNPTEIAPQLCGLASTSNSPRT